MSSDPKTLPFAVMDGAGNLITILDMRQGTQKISADEAVVIAQHHKLRFDQLMVLYPSSFEGVAASMVIFNQDGSLSGACGNGTRCVAWYLMEQSFDHDTRRDAPSLSLQTEAGLLNVWRKEADEFMVDMGKPRFDWQDIPLSEPFQDTRFIELSAGPIGNPILHSPSVVNMGNPHAIFWVDDMNAIDLAKIGPILENHPLFPERANISVAPDYGARSCFA